jgi:hypothetical protein
MASRRPNVPVVDPFFEWAGPLRGQPQTQILRFAQDDKSVLEDLATMHG